MQWSARAAPAAGVHLTIATGGIFPGRSRLTWPAGLVRWALFTRGKQAWGQESRAPHPDAARGRQSGPPGWAPLQSWREGPVGE